MSSIRPLNFSLLLATALLAVVMTVVYLGITTGRAVAQSDPPVRVTHMAGDSDAVWIATEDGRLIHCWYPEGVGRTQSRGTCRVLDRWNVDVIR